MTIKTSEQPPQPDNWFARLKIPHVFVLLFGIIIITWALTYILPAGEFDRQKIAFPDGTTRSVLVPGTFHHVDPSPAGPMDLATAFYDGLIAASSVVFLIFFSYACFHMVLRTGALDSFVHRLLKASQGYEWAFIVIFSFVFSLGGSMLGMLSEFYGFIPVFISLAIAMRYDAIVGFALVNMSSHIGFAVGTTNPFTVGVAQAVSELPIYSGLEFRIIAWFFFTAFNALYIIWYARRIRKDPTKSVLYGLKSDDSGYELGSTEESKSISSQDFLVLLTVGLTIATLIYGTLEWKWGMRQIVGLFTVMCITSGFVAGWNANRIAEEFVLGCRGIVYGAMVTGLARGILVILEKGKIVDTIMNSLAMALEGLPSWVAAQGMLVVQTFINFLIPSGSGQAATTMPIMAGMADLMGVSRQVAVLAFQFGDGFANLLWPTCGIVVACAIAKVPLERWWRFYIPFFLISYVFQMGFIMTAIAIGYQ